MGRFRINKMYFGLALALILHVLPAISGETVLPEIVQTPDGAVLKDALTVWAIKDLGNTDQVRFFEKSGIYFLNKNAEKFSANIKAMRESLDTGKYVTVEINVGTHEVLSATQTK
jgi:hypothetical protein